MLTRREALALGAALSALALLPASASASGESGLKSSAAAIETT